MERQSIEERIREVDTVILRVAREYSEQLLGRQPLRALDERVRFLRVLFRRRDGMLDQYARAGGNVKGLYTYDAVIGGTDDGEGGMPAGAEDVRKQTEAGVRAQ